MGRLDRFVPADNSNIKRIDLSDGDWIEVKKKLNTGEDKTLGVAGQMAPASVNGNIVFPIDWSMYEFERAMIWLLDWSFRGADDKPVPLTMEAIKALDPLDFDEINTAIIHHMMEVKQEADAKKAGRATQMPTLTPGT